MAPQSGVTYVQKPAFIDKMIEVGSHHFFKSFGNLNLAAAEAENGENIGISAAAGAHASEAYWHLQKTLELYDALVLSIEPLPVSDRAKKILSSFAPQQLKSFAGSSIMFDNPQWEQFAASVKTADPVRVIRDFVDRVRRIEPTLKAVVDRLASGEMNPQELHACITKYLEALLFGQYIAEFNRSTRDTA